MTPTIVPAAIRDAGRDNIADVTYFVVRVLRNALRNYPETPVSTEGEPYVRLAAATAVREIEEREKSTIPKLGNERLRAYIGALEENLRTSLETRAPVDRAESVALLNDLRAEEI